MNESLKIVNIGIFDTVKEDEATAKTEETLKNLNKEDKKLCSVQV